MTDHLAVSHDAPPPTPEHPTPGVQAQHVRRSFGSVLAVADVSFTAPAGAVTALIGPNGSGKTTLLLMLAGLLKPDAGQINVAGFDMTHSSYDARIRIGWMPDTLGTWDALTCAEIMSFYGQAYGLSKGLAAARAGYMLNRVYLADYANAPARVLSRGQKQRLGLARALVHDPQVVLLDEPASGLDPRSRIELRDMLRSLADAGKTVLVSSHVLSELEEIADHSVFLQRGQSVDMQELQQGITQRGWRLDALEPAALQAFLNAKNVAWRPGLASTSEIVVNLANQEAALALLRDAIVAGVPLHTIAPVSGRLEEAYLSLDGERQ
ncbi:MAG: ABC transporter ATP-binding protein [Propionibacteriaceae bacterium]|jgi:ABC-type multidrug transport system ATPase subunit|nr:ABC transporter ATP-binding protein [Propionibacteriaceae bacterium]